MLEVWDEVSLSWSKMHSLVEESDRYRNDLVEHLKSDSNLAKNKSIQDSLSDFEKNLELA